jgi:hypothetical protein
MSGREGPERRKHARVAVRIPVRVQGRDPNGSTWEEISSCQDVSVGGVGLTLKHPVQVGQVLHLSLPLPARLRQHDLTDPSYRVYALVRSVRPGAGAARLGLLFLGKHPPRGAESLPGGVFLLPGDPEPVERRRFPRYVARFLLRLEAEWAPGGVAREERTETEDVSAWGAKVKSNLPAAKGTMLQVEEVGGEFRTRAEVRGISIGTDGLPRLSLLFLDGPVPERLLPPVGHEEAAG